MNKTKQKQINTENKLVVTSGEWEGERQDQGRGLRGIYFILTINEV